jgi:predicted metal-dependent HD superfamily phosphohydrolase
MFSLFNARYAGLRARYAEPHRFYHGQAHVDALLHGLYELADAVTDPVAMELAIWYHDAVYDPAAHDNEARSAALLRAEMAGLADPTLIAAAELMVQLTAGHALPPEVPEAWRADCAIFLDLDLAVLGAAPALYDAYEHGIAAEYLPVHGAAAYRAGRTAFLHGLLQRPRLFHTERFHVAFDAPARANLRRALGGLAQRFTPDAEGGPPDDD